MIKQAVILAAGLGSRFGKRTENMPKGFIEIDNVAIVEQSIKKLISIGIEQIIIGTGYKKEWYEKLASKYPCITTVYSKNYEKTSSMETLSICAPLINGDFLLLESDLIYDIIGLNALKNDARENLILASGKSNSHDEVYLECDKNGALIKVSKDKSKIENLAGELVGITKLSKIALNQMCEFFKTCDDKKIDYENVLENISKQNSNIFIKKIEYYAWAECDDETMLTRAINEIYPRIKENESLLNIRREILLNPGPSTTTDSVKYAQIVPDICPRENEFGDLMEWISNELTNFVANKDDYTSILFACSGTGANEAMISSCIKPNTKLLIIDNGAYGARLAQIANTYNINTKVFKSSTYEPLNIKALENEIKSDEFSAIAFVYHETTTGLLNDAKSIALLAKKYGLTTIVDAISAYAGMPINLNELQIDFMSATSNKHIGAMAGVSFVIAKNSELEKIKEYSKNSFYFDLYSQYKYFLKHHQMRFTPPVQTLYSLRQAIIETKNETIQKRFDRFCACHKILLETLKALDLKVLIDEKYQSHFITAILEPNLPKYSFESLHDYAKKFGFTIYPGKLGDISTFRIANMGDIKEQDMKNFGIILKEYLKSIKE